MKKGKYLSNLTKRQMTHVYFFISWFSHDVIKIKKQGIINPFDILVSLVIRASEDLSFCKFVV